MPAPIPNRFAALSTVLIAMVLAGCGTTTSAPAGDSGSGSSQSDDRLRRDVWSKPSKIDAGLFEMSFDSTLKGYTPTAPKGVASA